MNLTTVLLIVLLLILIGGFVPTRNTVQGAYYHGYGFGAPVGLVGVVLLVVLLVMLLR